MSGKNLWGDMPDVDSIRTPHEIVQEQGEFLTQATDGLLEIETERSQKGTLFSFNCSLHAPALKHRMPILRITHDIKLFPCILHHEQSGEEYTAKSQDEFESDLGSILSSAETKTIVTGLMAQARLERETA